MFQVLPLAPQPETVTTSSESKAKWIGGLVYTIESVAMEREIAKRLGDLEYDSWFTEIGK